jgi:hypothetical protein
MYTVTIPHGDGFHEKVHICFTVTKQGHLYLFPVHFHSTEFTSSPSFQGAILKRGSSKNKASKERSYGHFFMKRK